MSVHIFGSMLLEEIILLMVFLVMSKVLFEESIVADWKSIGLILMAATLDIIFESIAMVSGCDVYSNISRIIAFLSMGIYLRGDKKRVLRRVRAVVDTFLIYMMSISFYCGIVFVMADPALAEQFKYMDQKPFDLMVTMISAVFMIYLYFGLLRKGICLNFRCRERILMILFSLLVYVVSVVLSITDDITILPKGYRYLLIACISIVYIVTPLFMIKNRLSVYYEMGQKHQQELLELQLQHFEQYKEKQEETRRFRHDMINHLMTVQMLQQKERYREAGDYVDELLGRVSALSPKCVTGSDLLDGIVASKIERMEQLHISYEIDGVLDKGLKMNPVDICTIFSNALDNAIEALQKVKKERRFCMRIKRTDTYYMIAMQNTTEPENRPNKLLAQNRFTTKQNRELHGYGMQNMKKTVSKYGGEITADMEEDTFTVTIFLPVTTTASE